MTLRGHFDGKQIVLDEPVPVGLPAHTPVRIVFENGSADELFEKLLGLAGGDDLPVDYARNHEHYVKGTPKR